MAKKKNYELIGVGVPNSKSVFAGLPVTYMWAGNLTTVWVFGLHPTSVMDSDDDECEVIGNRELAQDAVETVRSIWQWFGDQRNYAVDEYLHHTSELERREQRMATNGQSPLG